MSRQVEMSRGRVLLVGGSGGLGSETARLLHEEGFELVITYHQDRERAQYVAQFGTLLQADITDAGSRAKLLKDAGAISSLVVFTGLPGRLLTGDAGEQMEQSFRTNALGPLALAREAAEQWKGSGISGSIVLFSTMQGVGVFTGSTPYAAAKAALIHGAKVLAKEKRTPWNIRVNVIAPGIINAGMAAVSIAAGKYNRYLDDGTIARYGTALDVARAVRFLIEPDNYITGQVIQVDGGITL